MPVDYDLVVIGSSPAGVYAAMTAARLKARVALVDFLAPGAKRLDAPLKYKQSFIQLAQVIQQVRDAQQWGVHFSEPEFSIHLKEAMQWAETGVAIASEFSAPDVLAAFGIDVISGQGQFRPSPKFGFELGSRWLRATTYLIATGSRPDIPEIEGLESTGYLTLETFSQLQTLPKTVAIIGGDPSGVELAQTLARLGSSVTLAVHSPQILPKEDPEAAALIQAKLEADGVTVITQTEVTQAKKIEDKKWIQAGNRALEIDEIIVATAHQPNVESLNLDAVGVKWNRRYIQIDQKLRTTNPRIYACGDVIGGYRFPHIALYEAKIAVKNALFFPRFNLDYRGIPWAIFASPPLARVGLTESQARRRYPKDVIVVRQYFKTVDAAVIQGEITGFCKVIGRENGEILGASIVGTAAGELIGAIALAMQHKIKIGALCQVPGVFSTFSDILFQVSEAWNHQRFQDNQFLQNLLEAFFNGRRSWTK